VPAHRWWYEHRDLGEAILPDGAAVKRPVVTVGVPGYVSEYLAVVDSGSPISVAHAGLFRLLGIDPTIDPPLYVVPLGIGGGSGAVPVFDVELELRPPAGETTLPIRWHCHLGARSSWRLPFAVLLGQRGWFDQFPSTIDAFGTGVDLPDDLVA
jgi:hypothetical protein